jgi:hypothetical protein
MCVNNPEKNKGYKWEPWQMETKPRKPKKGENRKQLHREVKAKIDRNEKREHHGEHCGNKALGLGVQGSLELGSAR